MSNVITAGATEVAQLKHQSSLTIAWKRLRQDKPAILGLIIILVFAILGIFAQLYCRYDPYTVDPLNALQAPSWKHLFGTDDLGRDYFARVMTGARYSLFLGFASELSGVIVGTLIGAFVGYAGGRVDNVVMRLCDIIQSIPGILLTIAVSSSLGPGYVTTIFALAITGVPTNIRTMRAQVLKIREMEYIEGAKALTLSKWKIITKYVIPNGWAPILTGTTMGIGGKIMTAAGLSYLGLGVQVPTPEWEALLAAAKSQLRYYPFLAVIPGVFIMLTTLAFNLFGEGIRDATDPALRR